MEYLKKVIGNRLDNIQTMKNELNELINHHNEQIKIVDGKLEELCEEENELYGFIFEKGYEHE